MTPNLELESLRRRRFHIVTGMVVILSLIFVIGVAVEWYSISR